MLTCYNTHMQTPYGELNVGDVFLAADSSGARVEVVDVDLYASKQDALIQDWDGRIRRIDWFKLMIVRYYKGN